jgi:hypothetical protein
MRGTDLEVAEVLAAARAPTYDQDERVLARVLVAFNAAGTGLAAAPARLGRHSGRSVRPAAKVAAAVALATGCGVAVAGLGVLPTPVQRLAHDVLGGVGIPAPDKPDVERGAGTAASTPTSGGSGVVSPRPSATTAHDLTTLCETVANNLGDWRGHLDASDRAALIAAAHGEPKVAHYCTRLLRPGAAKTTPAPTPSGTATASPSAQPNATHGVGHATHSPGPNQRSSNAAKQ